MTARILTVVVAMTILLSHVWATRRPRLSDGSAYCTGGLCRRQLASSDDNRPGTQLEHLLKSRISSIYSDSISQGVADASDGNTENMLDDKSFERPLEWRGLLEETGIKSDTLPSNGDANGHAKSRYRFYTDTQNPTPASVKFPQVKRETLPSGLIPQSDGVFSWQSTMYKPEEIGRVAGKRQQGWHIQYGKRDSIEVDQEPTVAGSSASRIPNLLQLSKSMRQSHADDPVSGKTLDQIPLGALDFVFLSKGLTHTERGRLVQKLASVLENLLRQEEIETEPQSNEQEPDGRAWLESSTPSYQSPGHRRGGGVSAYNSKLRPDTTNEKVMGGSNRSSEMMKRQQGWHINYGKRDGGGQTYY